MNKSKIAFDYNDYMTIEALEDNVEISLTRVSEYGINGIGWTKYKNKIVVNSGDFVSIKDTLNKGKPYGNISINGKCNLRGNCNSLIFGDYASSHNDLSEYYNCFRDLLRGNSGVQEVDSNFLPATILSNWCYNNMFSNCTSLTTAPELPATTLASDCYGRMFEGCKSLTTVPELPATTLAEYCYSDMFGDCIALIAAPQLPATTLALSCYSHMFDGCTSLTTAPELPATALANSCYQRMFYGCTSLITSPQLPATTLVEHCYNNMFSNCTSLTTAPELPATTLVERCYEYMFDGCKSLTTAPELPATTLAKYCYYSMFEGCKSLTSAPELPATTLATSCYDSMFSNCTSLTTAPELPATTLVERCYSSMFYYCTNLTTAPELPATTLAYGCYNEMFRHCTSLTTAPELPATTLATYCYEWMFEGCTKLNYIKMLATDISARNCLYSWVGGIAFTGTFVKNPAMNSLPTGVSGIPSGWTVVNDGEESGGGGSNLTFPVTLVEGDNGQLGIDVYNYFITKYTDEDEIEESLFVSINGVTKQLNKVCRIMSDYNIIVFISYIDNPQGAFNGVSYLLRNTGNLEYSDPSSSY